MSFIVAVMDYVFPSLEPERRVLVALGVELCPQQCRSTMRSSRWARDVDGVLNCYAKMTARIIEKLKRCKIIVRYGMRNRPAAC
jgi:D-3-phosphoglycerate dehydrogenase